MDTRGIHWTAWVAWARLRKVWRARRSRAYARGAGPMVARTLELAAGDRRRRVVRLEDGEPRLSVVDGGRASEGAR